MFCEDRLGLVGWMAESLAKNRFSMFKQPINLNIGIVQNEQLNLVCWSFQANPSDFWQKWSETEKYRVDIFWEFRLTDWSMVKSYRKKLVDCRFSMFNDKAKLDSDRPQKFHTNFYFTKINLPNIT